MPSESVLYVQINAKNNKYIFKVVIKEDLYAYIKKNWKDGRLWNCACVVVEECTKNISYFEQINGNSLNEVYKNTFVHYFGNHGNPACNAIDRFLLDINKESSKIRSLIELKNK